MSSVRRDVEEVNTILGINSIIIQLGSGIPLYDRQFLDMGVDPTLIGGFSSALSAMFQDISSLRNYGFQTFQAKFLHMTIHKLEHSALLVISKTKIPKFILNQIETAHYEIETRFFFVLKANETGFQRFPREEIDEVFDKHHFKVLLLDTLQIDSEQLDIELGSIDIYSNRGSHLQLVCQFVKDRTTERNFKINLLRDFLLNNSVSERDVARLFIFLTEKQVFIRSSNRESKSL